MKKPMMNRRQIALGLAISLLSVGMVRAETQLTGAEMFDLLNGNTISGDWVGTPYKSYYAPDGVTVYVPENGPAQRGRWRINYDTDEYESWWEQSGWSSYRIVRGDDGGLSWVFRDTRQPFDVLDGKQVSW